MAPNMCYYRDADAIADVLNGENGIELQDVLTGVIGLCRIVASQQAQINVIAKDFRRIAEEYRREIIGNSSSIKLLSEKLIEANESLILLSQLVTTIKKEGE